MGALRQIKVGKIRDFVDTTLIAHNPFLRHQNRPLILNISRGHEIRPRGGLLLVTTLHFYLHRYFPVAIDRSIREHSFLENLHMGNQGVSDLLRRPASGPFAWLKSF